LTYQADSHQSAFFISQVQLMARPKNESLTQRNQAIYNALYVEHRPIADLSREYKLERASLYRAARSVTAESFADNRTARRKNMTGLPIFLPSP